MGPPHRDARGFFDLGIGAGHTAGLLALGGLVPAATAAWCGVATVTVVGAALAGALVSAGTGALVLRSLRRSIVRPLDVLGDAMEQMRQKGAIPRLPEVGAPMLQPMLRRFNLAAQVIAQRAQASQANFMSIEVAFDRVHAVLQSLREGVVVVDLDGKIVLANRSARQIVRCDDGTIEGRRLVELVGGTLQEAVLTGMAQIDENKAGEVHKPGIEHGARILDLTIVQTQSTRPDHDFGKVVVLVDVTRNHELSRLKDELLSSISHELRTPLTNMCSSSEILAQMDLAQLNTDEWREFVAILNAESHRLKTIVDDVMEFSQLETGRYSWQLERIDVVRAAQDTVQLMRGPAELHEIKIEVHAEGTAWVQADRHHLVEVMARILDNALKFTPHGGTVSLTVSRHDDLVDIAIADSGPGVRPEDRQRVFERFIQIGDLLTEKPRGAGLGLSICQRIVDAMRGTIWCEESPLGGAQFRFVLPAAPMKSTYTASTAS